MDDALRAYGAGHVDGLTGCRDEQRATDAATGADYRMGFLDARMAVFRMHAELRKIVDESGSQ